MVMEAGVKCSCHEANFAKWIAESGPALLGRMARPVITKHKQSHMLPPLSRCCDQWGSMWRSVGEYVASIVGHLHRRYWGYMHRAV